MPPESSTADVSLSTTGKKSKLPLLFFEALGSLACGYYGNYVFFRFRHDYGFGDLGNLLVAALMGLVVAIASWQGGKFAQRHGCFRAMTFGLVGLIVALAAGYALPQLPLQIAALVLWTASQFLIWPALEALVTDGTSGSGRAHIVGVYSIVWAACSALSYFFGGVLFEWLGSMSIFWLPPVLHVAQLLVLWHVAARWPVRWVEPVEEAIHSPAHPSPVQGVSPRTFQRMAWIANPFACVAAFTLLAMIAAALGRAGAPVVDLSGMLADSPFPRIRSDEELVGRMAAEHLLERGFQRFAFCGYTGMDWSDVRCKGFVERVAKAGYPFVTFEDPKSQRPSGAGDYEDHGERHERALKQWLKSLPKPCGVMACNDARGRQLLNCCRDATTAVPDELAVIGVDKDEIFCELSDLPLSSVILNAQQIGSEAAALLDRMMNGGKVPAGATVIKPVGVLARQSTDVLAIEDRHIAEALRFIREHACEGMDVEMLLKAVPLSRSVLERRFAKILGTSPKAEILRVRLDRVCCLLAESDLTLAEVAEKAGFEHPEYMSRLFKGRMGITPGEYRKQAGASGFAI